MNKPVPPPSHDASEAALELEIQATASAAPRLCPQDIDAAIVGETFHVLPSGRVTVCELTLRNGFTVRGESAVVSIENFNAGIGQKIARDNARNKVWELEGYLLRERLHQDAARLNRRPNPAHGAPKPAGHHPVA